MPNNANKIAYKEKEFETYLLWKSMPVHIRGMTEEQLNSYGFTDPLVLKIAKIKNQTAFAKHFKIKDLGTLTDWNNKIKNNNLDTDKLNNIFEKQFSNINKEIISQPIEKLEKMIREKDREISVLRGENTIYKKQLQELADTIEEAKHVKLNIVKRETFYSKALRVILFLLKR